MALDSFSDLVSEVAGWLDDGDLASRVPSFVRLAEARFNRLLRTPEMETTATLTASAGSAALPIGFLEMRALWIDDMPDRPLEQTAPIALKTNYAGGGAPAAYAISGATLLIAPQPAANVTLGALYYAAVPALSSTRATNWLLKAHPDIYLLGCLVAAELRGWNDERLPLLKAALDEALGELGDAAARRRHGGAPLIARAAVRNVAGAAV